jgi:hypothetical protein
VRCRVKYLLRYKLPVRAAVDVAHYEAARNEVRALGLDADNVPDIQDGSLGVKLDVQEIPLSAYHIKR